MRYRTKMALQKCPLRHLNREVIEDKFNFLVLIENSIRAACYLLSNILARKCVSSIKDLISKY